MQLFNEALGFWVYCNGVALAGVGAWALVRVFLRGPAATGPSRWKLAVLAGVCGFVALFAFADATSLIQAEVSFNALGKAVTAVVAVFAPKLVAFTCRFASDARRERNMPEREIRVLGGRG